MSVATLSPLQRQLASNKQFYLFTVENKKMMNIFQQILIYLPFWYTITLLENQPICMFNGKDDPFE